MNWVSFVVKTFVVLVVLWLLLFLCYGNLVLVDTVVPIEGIEVDEWISSYQMCGKVSGILGFICAAIWFQFGKNYAGESGIKVKFYALWIVSLVLSVLVNVIFFPDAVEGTGLAHVFVILMAPVLYWISSLFASAPAVKYIPSGAGLIHK